MARSSRKPRIIFSFMSIGHYRREPMNIIFEHFGDNLKIFAGEFAVDRSIRTLGPSELPICALKTFSVRDRLFVQVVPVLAYVRVPILLADLNPRIIHLWPILIVRRILGRPTILWGSAWPRNGRNSKTTPVRVLMQRLASRVITYTHRQAMELQAVLPNLQITAAPNSLYRAEQCAFEENGRRNNFVYVGRIVSEKKVALLIDAFAQVSESCEGISLTIVGDGPEFNDMRDRANQLGMSQRVEFLGHIDDVEQLRLVYSRCIAAVSPGYVGLSATQSFGFGVPMIVAESEPHSPEIEAIRPGFNARFFPSDSVAALASEMKQMIVERNVWSSKGPAIAEECRRNYSAEAMAAGVIEAVKLEARRSCVVL